jgi:hypothetical protein
MGGCDGAAEAVAEAVAEAEAALARHFRGVGCDPDSERLGRTRTSEARMGFASVCISV